VEPDFRAAYLNNPAPAYPLAARRRGIAGKVVLRAEVTPEGFCADVRVERSSGHELLDDTALEAVRKWRFVPAKRAGRAVAATVTIPINFKLENGEG
jgi:protein TonB